MGPLPELKFYGADYMPKERRARFLEWYDGEKYTVFDNGLLTYCLDDVNVLHMDYSRKLLKLIEVDAFRQAITKSPTCNKTFRKPDIIGILLRARYRLGDRQSVEALKRLAYVGRKKKTVHAKNGREVEKYICQGCLT
jgi:hypothetical protein